MSVDLTGQSKLVVNGEERTLSIKLGQVLVIHDELRVKGIDQLWNMLMLDNHLGLIYKLVSASTGIEIAKIEEFNVEEAVIATGLLLKPMFFGNRFDTDDEEEDDGKEADPT